LIAKGHRAAVDCRLSPLASDNYWVDHTNALSVGEAFILNAGKLKIVCFGDFVGAARLDL